MMENLDAAQLWAEEEFAHARLRDKRRTARLVDMAAEAARHPAGRISALFSTDAQRQGAYDWLENPACEPGSVARASHQATARRCQNQPLVFVPVDKASLTLADPQVRKDLGPVGTRVTRARGLQVMSAIAVDEEGTPQGLLGQAYWSRTNEPHAVPAHRRPVQEKETRYWEQVMGQARQNLSAQAAGSKPWFQVDREGDAWPVIVGALELRQDQYLTIRASWNRRLQDCPGSQEQGQGAAYLWGCLQDHPVLGDYQLHVSAGPKRTAREAIMQLRAGPVTLDLYNKQTKTHQPARVWAVLVQESTAVPAGQKPIEWLLLTTYPVHSVQDAGLVVWAYTQRWRIEEFHKAWKSGCRVEDIQLEESERIVKWAIILAAVAMRLVRLTYLARHQPQRPARQELTEYEVEALLDLDVEGHLEPATLTVWEAVDAIARLGGYVGPSSGGPPGMLVLTRGWVRVQAVATAYRNRADKAAAG